MLDREGLNGLGSGLGGGRNRIARRASRLRDIGINDFTAAIESSDPDMAARTRTSWRRSAKPLKAGQHRFG